MNGISVSMSTNNDGGKMKSGEELPSVLEELQSKGKTVRIDHVSLDPVANGCMLRVSYNVPALSNSDTEWGNVERVYKTEELEEAFDQIKGVFKYKLGL